MVFKHEEIVNELKKRTGYYKYHLMKMVETYEDILIDMLKTAEIDDPVEIHIAKGLRICADKNPEHAAKDPRNQNDVIVPERIIPYASFTQTFKQKIND